jgi:hypothetical protein
MAKSEASSSPQAQDLWCSETTRFAKASTLDFLNEGNVMPDAICALETKKRRCMLPFRAIPVQMQITREVIHRLCGEACG